jgi:RNA polymerase sigma-70 factor (ECF subfamily)
MQTPAIALGGSNTSLVVAVVGGQERSKGVNPERRVAFEDVLSHNLPRFRRMAMRWLRNPEDAEDAVQDAMLSAFKHIARFEGRAQMSTWLTAIVINAVRMQIRRRPRYTVVALDQPQEDERYTLSERIADPRPTPEQTLRECEMRQLIIKFSRSLPSSQQSAMQLRQRDGLSIKEAAQVLGVPVGTVKAWLARGRVAVKKRLRKAIEEPGIRKASSASRGKISSSSGCRRHSAEDAALRPPQGTSVNGERQERADSSGTSSYKEGVCEESVAISFSELRSSGISSL